MSGEQRANYRLALRPLLDAALQSGNLRDWSAGFLTASGRRLDSAMKGAAILALEDYLMAHATVERDRINWTLVHAFADEIRAICRDDTISLRINYNGVAWLIDGWRTASLADEHPTMPSLIMPICAAVGTGVYAVAFKSIHEGARLLMHMAAGSVPQLREAVAVGLARMLQDDWTKTMHELRRYVHIGDAHQHRAAVLAISDQAIIRQHQHALDALDLLHAVLAAYRRSPRTKRHSSAMMALNQTLSQAIASLLLADRRTGFSAAQMWIAWGDTDIQGIVFQAISEYPLAALEESVLLRKSFLN